MAKIYLKVYTREVDANCYPEGLAYGIHMAYSTDGKDYVPFNKNYGILFAKAEVDEKNTILPKGAKNPEIVALRDGSYGVIAVRIHENGMPDDTAEGQLLFWKTTDFIEYEDMGLVSEEQFRGMEMYNPVLLDEEESAKAIRYWMPVACKSVELPSVVEISGEEELDRITAKVIYSDGSVSVKRINWDKSALDCSKPGDYTVKGKIVCDKYRFPLAEGYGDPVIFKWEDKWYYISTNDNLDDIGIYVREAECVGALFEEGVKEHLILPYDERRELIQTFWAPEFHVIGGELYILFAVSGKKWGPQCHLMKLKKGGSIIRQDSWEDPVRIKKADGSYLADEGITLDMTYIKTTGCSCVVWSYRENIMTPLDSGSMLYIASIDEEKPWMLSSEPVLLTRPLLGWENVAGTINNEGPYAFVHEKKVYLTYSGGSANSYTYALGMLTASEEDNLLDLNAWKKSGRPVLTFYSVEGEYGPGHNSFYRNEEGDLMIAYHGETALEEHLRCDGIRRVHFRVDGTPDFGLSAEEDLKEAMSEVSIAVTVK